MTKSCASKHRVVCRSRESGVALFIALLCVLVLSMLAAGVIFVTQTELWTTANYRQVTQARYVAEAGAEQAANWIIQNWTPPSTLTNTAQFNLSVFPALYVGGSSPTKIVFASTTMGAITDSYPSTGGGNTLDSSFQSSLHAVSTPFTAIKSTSSFDVAAQLLSATQVTVAGGSQWLTKWKIISQGSVGGYHNAKVQVVEIIADVPTATTTTQTVPNFNYGVLATGQGCGVVSMAGGQYTNAYNSQAAGNPGNASPTLLGTGGSVASFGNIAVDNGAYINGNVYTPYYNAGTAGTYGVSCQPWSNAPNCHNANGINNGTACSSPSTLWSVNEDNSGSAVGCTSNASCSQVTANLPASLPSPSAVPNATMPSVATNTAACSGFNGLCNGGSGGGSGCAITIPPNPSSNYGVATFGSCAVITLTAGIYNFDTLAISNGAQVIVPSNSSVVINIFNASNATTPLNVNGGTVANNGGDPNNLTFVYNGTKTINLAAGANMFATVYAPNAAVTVSGNAGLYGAIVGKTFNFSGSGHVIYDTHLASESPNVTYSGTTVSYTAHLDEFSWSSY